MKDSKPFLFNVLIIAMAFAFAAPTGYSQSTVSSLTYYGITWTFEAPVTSGTFANGEPWVVGPVTITDINPSSAHGDPTNNGSMVNPIPAAIVGNSPSGQGFTASASEFNLQYVASRNVSLSLPITLGGSNTLVSSLTQNIYPFFSIKMVALTILEQVPPAGSFRPPVYGGIDKSVKFNINQVNTSFLPNFAPTPHTPSVSTIQSLLPALPWIELVDSYYGGQYAPYVNESTGLITGTAPYPSTYGREIAYKWGNVGLWLCTSASAAEKHGPIVQTIQDGIDIGGYIDAQPLVNSIPGNGQPGFTASGGHRCGRKFPVLFAACALNDPHLLFLAGQPNLFQEDQQTFFVKQSDVGRPVLPPCVTYSGTMVGIPEWGIEHSFLPQYDDSRWSDGTPYRFVVWPAMIGPSLAAELMGKSAAWGPSAIFAYNQRFVQESGLLTGQPATFVTEMWSAHSILPPQNLHVAPQ